MDVLVRPWSLAYTDESKRENVLEKLRATYCIGIFLPAMSGASHRSTINRTAYSQGLEKRKQFCASASNEHVN